MYVVILGGQNDHNGILSEFTKKRIEKFYEIYKCNKNLKVILSGGFRFSTISHCKIVRKIITKEIPDIIIEKEFEQNNDTIDEAINLAKYFSKIDYSGQIIILTSNWHLDRSKYLFDTTFKNINKINLEYITTNENNTQYIKNEKIKLDELINNPYGKWLSYKNKDIN